tara:strand:+ start:604 stop:720 length:117 start_codon:yes stop_codon:yes gene_type:complete
MIIKNSFFISLVQLINVQKTEYLSLEEYLLFGMGFVLE